MRHQRKLKSPSQQRGVVLFVALILLLILSLLGVTAARMQTTEERMARNEDNRQIGAQAAEAALRAAETGLTTGVYGASQFSANTNGLYELNPSVGSVLWGPPALVWSAAGAAITYSPTDPAEPDAGFDLAAGGGAIAEVHHRESAGGRHARRQHRPGAVCSTDLAGHGVSRHRQRRGRRFIHHHDLTEHFPLARRARGYGYEYATNEGDLCGEPRSAPASRSWQAGRSRSALATAPPTVAISQVPMTVEIPAHPQILLAVGNSQSMDGTLSGAIYTGAGACRRQLTRRSTRRARR